MSYIGREPQIGNFQMCDAISVVNNQAAYTMQVGGVAVIPGGNFNVIASVNGVVQKAGTSFTISSSTITFSQNLVTGDVIDFILILGSVLDLGVPSDGTVTTGKIADNAVTSAKLASGLALGKIGQVVQTVKTDTFSTSSSSFTAITGLSVAITPSATSSKILIRTVISYGGDQNLYGFAKILRGSTDILVGDAGASSQIRATFPMMNTDGDGPGEIYKAHVASSEFLDSPSSTSELTYSVHVSTYVSKNIFINRESNDANAGYNGRYTSSITAMEVLA